jgi:hypothetical protein
MGSTPKGDVEGSVRISTGGRPFEGLATCFCGCGRYNAGIPVDRMSETETKGQEH